MDKAPFNPLVKPSRKHNPRSKLLQRTVPIQNGNFSPLTRLARFKEIRDRNLREQAAQRPKPQRSPQKSVQVFHQQQNRQRSPQPQNSSQGIHNQQNRQRSPQPQNSFQSFHQQQNPPQVLQQQKSPQLLQKSQQSIQPQKIPDPPKQQNPPKVQQEKIPDPPKQQNLPKVQQEKIPDPPKQQNPPKVQQEKIPDPPKQQNPQKVQQEKIADPPKQQNPPQVRQQQIEKNKSPQGSPQKPQKVPDPPKQQNPPKVQQEKIPDPPKQQTPPKVQQEKSPQQSIKPQKISDPPKQQNSSQAPQQQIQQEKPSQVPQQQKSQQSTQPPKHQTLPQVNQQSIQLDKPHQVPQQQKLSEPQPAKITKDPHKQEPQKPIQPQKSPQLSQLTTAINIKTNIPPVNDNTVVKMKDINVMSNGTEMSLSTNGVEHTTNGKAGKVEKDAVKTYPTIGNSNLNIDNTDEILAFPIESETNATVLGANESEKLVIIDTVEIEGNGMVIDEEIVTETVCVGTLEVEGLEDVGQESQSSSLDVVGESSSAESLDLHISRQSSEEVTFSVDVETGNKEVVIEVKQPPKSEETQPIPEIVRRLNSGGKITGRRMLRGDYSSPLKRTLDTSDDSTNQKRARTNADGSISSPGWTFLNARSPFRLFRSPFRKASGEPAVAEIDTSMLVNVDQSELLERNDETAESRIEKYKDNTTWWCSMM